MFVEHDGLSGDPIRPNHGWLGSGLAQLSVINRWSFHIQSSNNKTVSGWPAQEVSLLLLSIKHSIRKKLKCSYALTIICNNYKYFFSIVKETGACRSELVHMLQPFQSKLFFQFCYGSFRKT